jgi:sugar phosphate isomerase/epimerase
LQEKSEDLRYARLGKSLSTLPGRPVAICHVRLFDSEQARTLDDQTIVVNGNQILQVGPAAEVKAPSDALRIDGTGKTLLPGLFDMLVHLNNPDGLLNIACGVTSVRDMGNDIETLSRLKANWDSGRQVGPRVFRAGLIDGRGPFQSPTGLFADTLKEALAAANRYIDLGYSQIKLTAADPTQHRESRTMNATVGRRGVVMRIGIFTKVFERATLAERLDAVRAHGLDCVQFDLSSAGSDPMPERIDPALCEGIRNAFTAHCVTMSAVNGTFNMIHPDLNARREGLLRLRELALACESLGTSVITLCTGTRDPHSMWRRHPDNDAPDAWDDLLHAMEEALTLTEETGVTLAFEPEVSNVVDSARKGRLLLDTLRSPRLKVVMDGANIFHDGELPHMRAILEEAIDLLGPDIVIAHAKDLSHDGEAGNLAAGTGLLDYPLYLSLLQRAGFIGPLILHGLTEAQTSDAVPFLRNTITTIA